MSKIVSNATPLIYLAKIGRLGVLGRVFGQVIISEEVNREVVEEGKKLGKMDAYLIEKEIKEGWIKVSKIKELIDIPIKLEKGEVATLSLAKNLEVREVLIDEASARTASEILGLTPRGTIFVLLKALKIKEISFDEFLGILDKLLKEGFRLREEVYIEAVETAKKIAQSL
jgi:predicted nucleic acid-binding protein